MTRIGFFLLIALAAAVLAGTGCVPFWVYHAAVKTNENYYNTIEGQKAEVADSNRRAREAQSEVEALRAENEALKKIGGVRDLALEELQKLIDQGVTENPALAPDRESGDITVTPDHKIAIAGDVLFVSGSADLTPKAKDILQKLAPVLKDKFGAYYIRVEGHTDNQPIVKPETKAKFPTNWDLSVARAVSVVLELERLGIPHERIYAAGYGEWSPRVKNAPGKKGAAENRRVEIAIVQEK
jgi:chemotaxis protein MotB